MLVAIDEAMYAGGSNCGRQVSITRTSDGRQVTAVVADMCPTCDTDESLDLSQGAFEAIASQEEGKVSTLLFVLFFWWRY
jgi:rare lipoprotein A (peptidoglycan hydrolase)